MFVFNSKTYNFLRNAQLILPLLGTFYVTLAAIWSLPAAEQISGTVLALTTLLSGALKISSNTFNKLDAAFDGDLIVSDSPDGGTDLLLNISKEPGEVVAGKESVRFKVRRRRPLVADSEE